MRFITIIAVSVWFAVLSAQTKNSWPIFRGNGSLEGVTEASLPSKLNLLWSNEYTDGFKSSPAISENLIIAASMDGFIYGIDFKGNEKWRFKSQNGFEASPLVHNRKIYIGDLDGTFYCLGLQSGELLWKFEAGGQIMGSANLYTFKDKTLILFGCYDYFLYALDASNGSLAWKYESDNYINGAPACVDGVAVFGGCDGFLHLVDIKTGKLNKKIEVATYVAGSPAINNKVAYIGDYDGRISAFDLQTGAKKWMWEDKTRNLPFIGSPSVTEKYVLAGNRDKFLYCFQKESGKLLWQLNSGSRIDASVIVSGKEVLSVNMRGDIQITDLQKGTNTRSYETGEPISATPALIDGKIIVASDNGTIYCFGW